MLARARARERELAVRLAMGASRPRLARQMLAESLLLAAIGTACGTLLAQFLSSYLVRFLTTTDNPLYVDLGTDWRIFGFTAALAVLTCLLFGLMPAVRATRANPGTLMKASGRGLTENRERFGLRRTLSGRASRPLIGSSGRRAAVRSQPAQAADARCRVSGQRRVGH
jgi:putative ABC transport system permease protein